MKKLICVFASIIYMLSLFGCGGVLIDDTKEKEEFQATIDSLVEALDNKNSDAIYNLFSADVRKRDKDLKEQIENLLLVYDGTVDEVGWDGLLAADETFDSGKKSKNVYTSFPVRCGEKYYWLYLDLMYENTFDENKVGITQLDFLTADEYCLSEEDGLKLEDMVGLNLFVQRKIEDEIRCIHGRAYRYYKNTKPLDLSSVKEYLKTSKSFYDFKNHFGEVNAEGIYSYYELPKVDNKIQYLEICVDNDKICSVSIVDDFKFIELVYDGED